MSLPLVSQVAKITSIGERLVTQRIITKLSIHDYTLCKVIAQKLFENRP
jgi:hypothetical protein